MYKICVVTGSRAEYGIMKPLLTLLKQDSEVQLDIVATAMHMEEKYGYTYQVIESDGFTIGQKIPLDLKDTEKETVVKAISKLQIALSDYLSQRTYDLIIILGDRYEMLAVSNVALIYNIPVCHLHGGEKTLGNFDEYIRHAITKMSHLHLVSTEDYRQRVIQLGEAPKRVVHTGTIGVQNALSLPKLDRKDLANRLQIELPEAYYVVLFHPVTLETDGDSAYQIQELLGALEVKNVPCVFIGSNSDTGSDTIMSAIKEYVSSHDENYLFTSLTTQEYHSLVRCSKGLVGNSSSGLIEVPSLNVPTLNIGNRQKGRLMGASVVNVTTQKDTILKGLDALERVTDFTNPYWKEKAAETAYQTIKQFLQAGIDTTKDFYDMEFSK